jgi:phage gp29-like protein
VDQATGKPDPTLRTESGGKGIKLYDEVDRDAHAGACCSRAICPWWARTGDHPGKTGVQDGFPVSTDQDLAIADFVAEAIDNCARINQVRRELLQGILYGFYVAEVIWTRRPDGSVVPKRLIAKHPRRFVFTPARELRLLTPSSMIEGEEVPERKFMVFCYGDSDNPYGKGLGQKLWWWVWFKKNGVKFWLIFNEKFGMPRRGQVPSGNQAPSSHLMAALESIQAIPASRFRNMEIELPGGTPTAGSYAIL